MGNESARTPARIEADLAILGAGAAGLAAAIFAGESAGGTNLKILLIEGARRPGAKILVSGGGRCNFTNARVTPEDYCGGPRPIIRSVLKAFDERRAAAWIRGLGVELKQEAGGKLFPTTDSARTVLEALLGAVRASGAELLAGARVVGVAREGDGFMLALADGGEVAARRLILATGGLSLPKSGSDGAGLGFARALGHSIVPPTPALVPLVLARGAGAGGRFAELSGLTLEARLAVAEAGGRRIAEAERSLVFTHFGISGPAPMDLSRHLLRARLERPAERFDLLLGLKEFPSLEAADRKLRDAARRHPRRTLSSFLSATMPETLARVLAGDAAAGTPMAELPREARLAAARNLSGLRLEVERDRGWAFAETTAGGVELREIDPRTMASRAVPGLYLCGEMLDVDGRIGGFSFQWAWSSGYLAGRSAAAALAGAS